MTQAPFYLLLKRVFISSNWENLGLSQRLRTFFALFLVLL